MYCLQCESANMHPASHEISHLLYCLSLHLLDIEMNAWVENSNGGSKEDEFTSSKDVVMIQGTANANQTMAQRRKLCL